VSTVDKIKDTAHRIARLGAYLSNPYGPTAKKERGTLEMSRDMTSPLVLMCDLNTGRVWEREFRGDIEHREFPEPSALELLAVFERLMTAAIRRQLREEVLTELVEKRIRRITRVRSRGFKNDLKQPKSKK